MPSTGKAGRGNAITTAVIDEADFHEYLSEFYYAVKPSVDESGGQLILVSTSNYQTMTSLFKETYRGAPRNGFKKFFHGWRARVERTKDWYEARKSEYPDKARFEKEFPETDIEALSAPRSIVAIDPGVLDQMRESVIAPVETLNVSTHIYQRYYAGKRYVAFTDTSHGTGEDDSVTVVMDVTTGYVVADLISPVLTPTSLAMQSMELLELYHNPLWGIEDNDWGRVTIEKAQVLGYRRLYYRREGQVGWHTNEGNRLGLWEDLLSAVSARLITVPSREGLEQFYSIIRNPKKLGRIEAQTGAKDDYPMAVGGCWALRYRAGVGRAEPVVEGRRSQEPSVLLRW